jgi:hypothetical protein
MKNRNTIKVIVMAWVLGVTLACPVYADYGFLKGVTKYQLSDTEEAIVDEIMADKAKIVFLEAKVATLEQNCQQAVGPSSLENRVSTLEKAVEFLQTNVIQAINVVIGLVRKIIIK